METYVVNLFYGEYEDAGVKVLYAGNSYDSAYLMANDKESFRKDWTGSEIQTWENGVMTSSKDVF